MNDLLGERALSPLTAFLTGSALLWFFYTILMAGIREGAILNFIVTTAKLIPILLITFIAMSSVAAPELADSQTPLALILERTVVGTAGGMIVRLGIMVSVLGASLSWILLSVETLYAAITIATTLVLIPYLLTSLHAVKIALGLRKKEPILHLVIALLATLYSLYVIYAVGIQYLFLSVIFYSIGSLLFIRAKREQKKQPKRWEWAVIILLLAGAVVVTALFTAHRITF